MLCLEGFTIDNDKVQKGVYGPSSLSGYFNTIILSTGTLYVSVHKGMVIVSAICTLYLSCRGYKP